ncbi:MAG: YraN family protein [Woeseia sp.]
MDAQSVGEHKEQLALEHLLQAGLTLVTRNFRCRVGEVDLVMLDEAVLVFVEVRSRSTGGRPYTRFPSAIQSVGPQKQRKLAKAALFFLAKHKNFRNHVVRFDVVAYDGPTPDRYGLQWITDAFRPGS